MRGWVRFLATCDALRTLDEAGVDIGVVAGRDKHHLTVGDLDDVAAMEDGIGPSFQDHVVQTDAVATIDPDVPSGRLFAIIKDLCMQSRHKLARAQVYMHLRQCPGRDSHGAGLFRRPLFAIGFATNVDMKCLDVVGPVSTRDLRIRLNTLFVLGLGVGVVAGNP